MMSRSGILGSLGLAAACAACGSGGAGATDIAPTADGGRASDARRPNAGGRDATPGYVAPLPRADASAAPPVDAAPPTAPPSDGGRDCGAPAPAPDPACYDLWIDPRKLGVEDEVDFRWPRAPRRHFLADERSFHFGGHMFHIGDPNDFERWPGEVALATFDRESKQLVKLRRFDVFGPRACWNCRDVDDMALAPDGTFAILFHYEPNPATYDVRSELVVGHVDREGYQVVRPMGESDFRGHVVDWDGEAFAVHGNGDIEGSPPGWILTRVGTDGTVLLPPRRIEGGVGNDLRDMHYATDPVTGRTLSLSEARSSNDTVVLCAHDRIGQPLGDLGTGCIEFGPLHTPEEEQVARGVRRFSLAIALHDQGFVGYAQPEGTGGGGVRHALFRLNSPVSPQPPVVRGFVPFSEPRGGYAGDWREVQVVSRPGASWPWVITKTENGIERISFDDNGLAGHELLVWSPADRCRRFHECAEGVEPRLWDRAGFTFQTSGGESWLGSLQVVPEDPELLLNHDPARGTFRIMSARAGCQYVHTWDMVTSARTSGPRCP
jgi:hypothetical protein